ncbi:MAG: PqqD family protein [Prevotellaceae bacterium]|nr:PqqD family protein [Prevotellaceae bacterium]
MWEKLCGKEFTEEDMVKLLTEEYDVDQETAINDCKTLASQWKEAGIIE